MRKGLVIALSTVCLILLALLAVFFVPKLRAEQSLADEAPFCVYYLDVGQADAALVVCDGSAMLIDGGNVEDSRTIADFLEDNGYTHLDYMVATHPHEDHIGGLSGAFEAADVDIVLLSMPDYESEVYDIFLEEAEEEGSVMDYVQPGETFMLGSASVTVLGPAEESDDPNNMSIVLKVEYGDTSFLFMGDAEETEEKSIMENGADVTATVLKVGHHGSSAATGYEFLYNAEPEYAVISVGAGNSYGHPSEAALSRLRDAGVTVYRTDECGTIVCTSDGTDVDFGDAVPTDLSGIEGSGQTYEYDDDAEVQEETAQVEPVEEPAAEAESAAEPEVTAAETGEDTEQDSEAVVTSDAEGTETPEIDIIREEPEEYTYVLNTNTMRFHDPSCSSVQEMSDKNRAYTSASRDELIAAGYISCGNCKP